MTGYESDNIFAKIIRGEIPAHRVFENDDVLVMMDIFPQSRGHLLVIPKTDARNILDVETSVLSKTVPYVQSLARAVMAATGADGIRVAQFNEAPAGQSVFHLHFHVIPVYDGVTVKAHHGSRADDAELAELAKDIAAHI